ncbi:MAG: hypothetical protein MUC48_26665 [Leptolyngbya sp. Prado105]|jgi:hypothetical protein|nr:hypothetical protein [Leptolyngbya sp. Prado105]
MTVTESVLNPYDVLGVSQAASASEIAQAFAKATKQRKYPISAIAAARKQLMNPKERFVADYLRPILPTIQRLKRSDFSALDTEMPTLDLLPQFDGLETSIAQLADTSELDRRLGTSLFSSSPFTSSSVSASPRQSIDELRSLVAAQVAEEMQSAQRSTPILPPPKTVSQALIQTKADAKIVGGTVGVAIAVAIAGITMVCAGLRLPKISIVVSDAVSTPQEPAPIERPQMWDEPTEIPEPSFLSEASPSSPSDFNAVPSPSPVPNHSSSTTSIRENSPAESIRQFTSDDETVSSQTAKDSCGDRNLGRGNVTWYPVFINYSDRNLELSKNHYCRDAIKVYREDKQSFSIQVASFLNLSDAERFANLLRSELGSGEIGKTTLYPVASSTPPPARSEVLPPPVPAESARPQSSEFSFPMASCGDRPSGSVNTWHPVIIYTATEKLGMIRANYCGDAFRKNVSGVSLASNEPVPIQVASFLTKSDAERFTEVLRRRFNRVEVGNSYQFKEMEDSF